MPMIRTIVFDFGNVVAFFDHGRAVRRLARFTDMDAVELALQLYGSPIEDQYERGQLSTDDHDQTPCYPTRLLLGAVRVL